MQTLYRHLPMRVSTPCWLLRFRRRVSCIDSAKHASFRFHTTPEHILAGNSATPVIAMRTTAMLRPSDRPCRRAREIHRMQSLNLRPSRLVALAELGAPSGDFEERCVGLQMAAAMETTTGQESSDTRRDLRRVAPSNRSSCTFTPRISIVPPAHEVRCKPHRAAHNGV